MKKFFIVAITILAMASASAADFGLRAGVNSSRFDLSHANLSDDFLAFNKARTGWHAGAWMRLDMGMFFVQPELLYNYNSYDMNTWTTPASAKSTSKIKVQTLEVPALIGIKLLVLRLNAGPVFNLMSETSHSGGDVEQADVLKPAVSYTAGLGVDLSHVSLDVRYNGGFSRTKQTVEIGGESYASRTNFRGWTVGVGYAF